MTRRAQYSVVNVKVEERGFQSRGILRCRCRTGDENSKVVFLK